MDEGWKASEGGREVMEGGEGRCCLYLGGLLLVSTGHHADTSQVFLLASNFTQVPVCTPGVQKQLVVKPSRWRGGKSPEGGE